MEDIIVNIAFYIFGYLVAKYKIYERMDSKRGNTTSK